MQNNLPFKNIGIVGIGLIGGSFAKAFNNIGINIYGYDNDKNVLDKTATSGIFQEVTDEFDKFISYPLDLIYICLPIQAAINFINKLGSISYKGAVTDSCSTKTSILNAAKNNHLYFSGGHPIKGKETSGFINSEVALYVGAKYIQVSLGFKDLDDDLRCLHEAIKMEICIMDEKEHDDVFACVSHLPHLLSFCLIDLVMDQNKKALSFAGGGFKDFTRIAASDAVMWRDIIIDNKASILEYLDNLLLKLNQWKVMILKEEKKELFEKIEDVSTQRRKL